MKSAENPFAKVVEKSSIMFSSAHEQAKSTNLFTKVVDNPFSTKIQDQSSLQIKNEENPFLQRGNEAAPFIPRGNIKSRLGIKKQTPLPGNLIDLTKPSIDNLPITTAAPIGAGNTIELHNVPPKYFAREFLSPFYSEFGTVIKIDLKPFPRKIAFVTFSNRNSAQKAMSLGTNLDSATVIEITWPTKKKPELKTQPKIQPKRISTKRHSRKSLDDFKAELQNLAQSLSVVYCPTSLEKYELLDKLDKKIREGIRRDPKDYKVLVGTCVDMCPERERYFRNDKNQFSFFENTNGLLDIQKAVKEYSRSSADQEVPLPHELRTITALDRTMDYLISNIMDVQYSTVSEWFDFLWNRTRAIRKDITQQNFKCKSSISIVEKCTRFHIFCSHFLCEEEMHVFDTKINLENMTKCLQTLKHMYEDHWLETNNPCSNEAEFRGYQILLNLNDGDTLREVMSFSDDIRKSAPVKFALQCFSAVQENNYSRFFKLVKKADFLKACLMHQYFTQMRAIALKRMARAYVVAKSDLPYPLEDLMSILLFNDYDSASAFCNHYGFGTDEMYVYLSRSAYLEPEDRYAKERSSIINENCSLTMAEIVNNGPLKELPLYHPVDSFDSRGHYIGTYQELSGLPVGDEIAIDEVETEDSQNDEGATTVDEDEINDPTYEQQDEEDKGDDIVDGQPQDDYTESEQDDDVIIVEDKDEKDGDFVPEVSSKHTAKKKNEEEQIMILREDINKASTELVDELIHDVTKNTFSTLHNQWQENMKEAPHFVEYIIALVSVEDAKNIAVESMEEFKEDKQKEEGEILEQNAKRASNEIMDSVVKSSLANVCTDVYGEFEVEKQKHIVNDESKHVQTDIVESTIMEMVTHVANSVVKDTEIEKKTGLLKLKHDYQKSQLSVYFKQWIKAYKSHMYVKATLNDFPTNAPMVTTEEAIRNLNIREPGEQPKHLQVCADVSWLDNERNFKQSVDQFHQKFQKKRDEILKPISFNDILKKSVQNLSWQQKPKFHQNQMLTWEMKVIAPNNLGSTNILHSKLTPYILLKKLSTNGLNLEDQLKQQRDLILQRGTFRTKTNEDVSYRINLVSQGRPIKNLFLATSCICYIVHNQIFNTQYWQQEHRRLLNYLSSTPSNPHPPLLMLVVIGNPLTINKEQIEVNLGLDELETRKLIGRWCCAILDDVITDVNVFNESLEKEICAAMMCSRLFPQITTKPLSTIVEDGLSKLFFPSYHRYCLHCNKSQMPSPNPSDVVLFFNNVIDEISNMMLNSTINRNDEVTEPPDEASSNAGLFEERCLQLANLVTELKLPQLPTFNETDDFLLNHQYCAEYVMHFEGIDAATLLNRVNSLLRDHNLSIGNPDDFIFPWSDVLEFFIVHQLSKMYATSDHSYADGDDISYFSLVNYLPNVWHGIYVDNPLKNHIKRFNQSARDFDESGLGAQLKRKKFCREVNMQETIHSINDELSAIEDSMRQRKSRKMSSSSSRDQKSPISELVNQSLLLTRELTNQKVERSQRILLYSTLNPNAESFYPQINATISPTYTKQSTNRHLPNVNSLEDSVFNCVKSIDNTHTEWMKRQAYWESVLNS
eukprot:TCONS_00009720-protein